MSFSGQRLKLARQRRRLTGTDLGRLAGVSSVTISRLERTNNEPEEATVIALSEALNYPAEFFFKAGVDVVEPDQASFRSLKSMTAGERDASLAAASIAFEIADWIDQKFHLPSTEVPDMGHERDDPAGAAIRLRTAWGLGERPIGNMIDLLEAKGVRVFSLAENSTRVDAFSCWRNGVPFVFLNTRKSAERSRFDAAHELAHLCLHAHSGSRSIPNAEHEADLFAASLLMPERDVRAKISSVRSLAQVIKAKRRWGVSAAALTYRLSRLQILSEWHSRKMFQEISRLGYRTSEPDPMPREHSLVWQTVFRELWRDRITKAQIAKQFAIPSNELESLVFGLAGPIVDERSSSLGEGRKSPELVVNNFID